MNRRTLRVAVVFGVLAVALIAAWRAAEHALAREAKICRFAMGIRADLTILVGTRRGSSFAVQHQDLPQPL